ncbi:hypothetical protein ABT121_06280 [Streptomyces sp. NPDC001928]|uniref:hypothetical protein n=1 Tax=Streptomyces sp. NPDC001928 TaxID=3154404 RepID=UPI0033182D90
MAVSGHYWADRQKQQQILARLEEIRGFPVKIREDFLAGIARYKGWNGHEEAIGDSFYEKTNPEYEKANEGVIGTLDAYGEGIDGMIIGFLKQCESIGITNDHAIDLIEQGMVDQDEFEDSADGSGGRKP